MYGQGFNLQDARFVIENVYSQVIEEILLSVKKQQKSIRKVFLKRLHFFNRILPGSLFVLGMLFGCSSEKNTWTSKSYHNLTAHYNGYYYAYDEISKIESTIQQNNIDDYNRILRLFPTFDSSMAKGYENEIQETVKMASIAIQRHPNSKWVDDAYILVGKARMYSLDWGNAIETFKFVNGKSENPDARHLAIINLIRTFTEHKEYNNAQAAIDYLGKEKLSKTNRKQFYLIKAYFHQVQEDYDNMVRSLTLASPLLKKPDRSGRIYFIIGQVYQELGFEAEAFNFYRKCLSTNPEYETDFYARLYMAQVAEISRSKDLSAARKSFKRLLKDRKNREFRDKIYYEIGAFELKQKNIDPAINNFQLAIREGTNKRIDGEAYLRLGQIYYDTLKDYEMSQAYYDSAIGALPTDFENYTAIKARQEILNDFVKNLKTIEWQDSLLSMAHLDSAALRSRIDSVFKERARLEELAQGKKKKRKSNRIEIEPTNTNIFDTGEGTSETTAWYFGNPSAMSLGSSEFRRIWGDVGLEDDWRRSLKISSGDVVQSAGDAGANQGEITQQAQENTIPIDPIEAEFNLINSQIPRTEEQVETALTKIEDAYFRLGDIYYFNLEEKDNAEKAFKQLLERFPESEYAAEVLYKLYLINKDSNEALAAQYAKLLISNYPESTYARILSRAGRADEAVAAFAEAERLLPRSAAVQLRVAAHLVTLDRLDEAAVRLERATGDPAIAPDALLQLALLRERQGRADEAVRHLEAALRLRPDFAEARTALARQRAR
jgi:tetratricopeptide (TPR) repeat protein